jgi:transcriptional regulator with XRE-family HTH domain
MTAKEALLRSGRNLRQIRMDKNFSLEALSILSGVGAAVIEAMEAGDFDIPPRMVYELAAALNVDFREILVDLTADGGL